MPKPQSRLPVEIANLIARQNELTDDELADLNSRLTSLIDELGGDPSDTNLAVMEEAVEHVINLGQVMQGREEDRAERQERVAQLRARLTPEAPAATSTEPAAPATPATPATPVEEAAPVAETPAPETAPVAVAADASPAPAAPATTPAPAPASVPAPEPTLEEVASRAPAVITNEPNPNLSVIAAGDVPGYSAGSHFQSTRDIGDAFVQKWDAVRGMANDQGVRTSRFPVARFKSQLDSDHTLRPDRLDENSQKVNEVLREVRARTLHATKHGVQSLAASGGLCAPVDVHYGLAQISTADRPFRDSLPRFGSTRGGVQFITPPTLTDVSDGVRVTTEAEDAAGYTTQDPAGTTDPKPVVVVDCGTLVTETVDAVSLRLRTGNFNRFAFPEQFDTWYQNGLAWHARVAEGNLLARLANNTRTLNITEGRILGAAFDLIETYRKHAAQYRNRFRMGRNAPMQAWLPGHVTDQVAVDIMAMPPGDGLERFRAITEAWLVGAFANFNVELHFYEDEKTGGDQIYADQTDNAAGLPWLTVIEGYMAHPGAIVYLEAGTLDFGIDIRDTTLLATNDVESFMETFEGLAVIGYPPLAIRNTVCVSGATSAPIEVDCPAVGSV